MCAIYCTFPTLRVCADNLFLWKSYMEPNLHLFQRPAVGCTCSSFPSCLSQKREGDQILVILSSYLETPPSHISPGSADRWGGLFNKR